MSKRHILRESSILQKYLPNNALTNQLQLSVYGAPRHNVQQARPQTPSIPAAQRKQHMISSVNILGRDSVQKQQVCSNLSLKSLGAPFEFEKALRSPTYSISNSTFSMADDQKFGLNKVEISQMNVSIRQYLKKGIDSFIDKVVDNYMLMTPLRWGKRGTNLRRNDSILRSETELQELQRSEQEKYQMQSNFFGREFILYIKKLKEQNQARSKNALQEDIYVEFTKIFNKLLQDQILDRILIRL